MRNNFIRILLFCVPPLMTGCGDHNPPTIPYPAITTTAITDTSVSISWVAANDSQTNASALVYKVYQSVPDPAHGSFDTIAEVEAGTLAQTLTGVTSATITGLTAGAGYYINIVVQDEKENKSLYTPLGEYFHTSQIYYYPFSANAYDVTAAANHLVVEPTGLTTYPSMTIDRFGHPNGAYYFNPLIAPTTPQCLQSTTAVGISGSASRSVSFWVKSANPDLAARVPFSWGNGGANGSTFGLLDNGAGSNWIAWLWGTANVSTNTVVTTDWEHWVVGYDSGLVYTYKNGVVVNNGTLPLTAANTVDSPLYVGCGREAGVVSYPYMGYIDDVRVFNQLLSSTDVAKLYTVTSP